MPKSLIFEFIGLFLIIYADNSVEDYLNTPAQLGRKLKDTRRAMAQFECSLNLYDFDTY